MKVARCISAALLLMLSQAPAIAQSQQVSVELSLFSGRPRPRADIADAGLAQSILDSLDFRSAQPIPCSEVPAPASTPLYTGVLLRFTVPVLERKILVVHDGYISYDATKPCYRDPGSNLEKTAVRIAFRYDDANAPGGPKPMDYLACMVPDSLHPDIAPCGTSTGIKRASGSRSGPAQRPSRLPAPGNIALDGREIRGGRSAFSWSFPGSGSVAEPAGGSAVP